jgi:hypothetical protein
MSIFGLTISYRIIAKLYKTSNYVIPAKLVLDFDRGAGIQYYQLFPGFRVKPGMTKEGCNAVVQSSQIEKLCRGLVASLASLARRMPEYDSMSCKADLQFILFNSSN